MSNVAILLIGAALLLTAKSKKSNNPLNIEWRASNDWDGQTGKRGRFATFSTPDYGLRAAIKLLNNYLGNGYDTITKVVTKWAPPHENPTAKYIAFVSQKSGIHPNQRLYATDVLKIIKPMAKFESHTVLTDSAIGRASRLL